MYCHHAKFDLLSYFPISERKSALPLPVGNTHVHVEFDEVLFKLMPTLSIVTLSVVALT